MLSKETIAMKILILTSGSRGDVQPFLALSLGLKAAGYDVALAGPGMFEGFVTERGIPFVPVNDDVLKLKDTAAGKKIFEQRGAGLAMMRQVMPMLRRLLDDSWRAAEITQPDAIVYHPKGLAGSHLAEALRIPAFFSLPLPLYSPTRDFPMPIFPDFKLGAAYNRLTYAFLPMLTAPYAGLINTWRKEHGLPSVGRFFTERRKNMPTIPVLYSFSHYVVPRPADWDADTHVTGYWFLPPDENWQPSKELTQFLENGEPPVYVGFGSMVSGDPQAKAQMVIEALKRTEQRGILAKGWGGLEPSNVPESIHLIDEAPHDWLFPRMSAIIHHGGAGTTAAALRAGKPNIVTPFIADQPFWGRRIEALNAGPAPIPQKKLTIENLTDAVHKAVNDPTILQSAEALGEKIRSEDGITNAIDLINRYIGEQMPRVAEKADTL
jgi:sterol 3beta-glucosyltransferase